MPGFGSNEITGFEAQDVTTASAGYFDGGNLFLFALE
jgi:hypothetical protein